MTDDLDTFFRQALAAAGVTATADELGVLRLYHEALTPGLAALAAADLALMPLEFDLDPSRPPRR